MKLWDRFRSMPRAMQWGAWAGIGTVVTLLWTDVVMVRANEWNARADRTLARLEEVRSGGARLDRLETLEPYVNAIGPVSRPGLQAEAADALADAINDVLSAHSVSKPSFVPRPPAKQPRESLAAILGAGERPYRITGELSFLATPEVAASIIAALEARPEIEAISQVHLTKEGSNKVDAQLTVDAWLIKKEKSS
jgi:hypothetical protein